MQSKKITIDVSHTAKLAIIPLTKDEEEHFSKQFTSILNLVSQLQKIDTRNVAPTSQVTGLVNIFREDTVEPDRTFSQKEALANAKKQHNGYFVVPAIFG